MTVLVESGEKMIPLRLLTDSQRADIHEGDLRIDLRYACMYNKSDV